jgi:GH35 family endo-1,4-beta-xylanase
MARRSPTRNTQLGLEQLELREVLSAGTGLEAQFYANPNLTNLATTRIDPVLNDQWAAGTSPAAGVGTGGYSVRWSGQIEAQYTETYTFTVTADQSVQLWVDGQQLVNAHGNTTPAQYSGSLALVSGRKYDIEVDYENPVGGGQVQLQWASPSQAQQVIPVGQLFPSQRGGLLREVWTNVPGSQVSDLTNSPNYSTTANVASVVPSAAVTDDVGANYGERLSGTVYAPVSGYYRFILNTTDAAALYLSNSIDPSGQQLIAQSSGSGAMSAPVYLVAGQGYSIEALHKVGAGSTGLSIGWARPDGIVEQTITGDDVAPVVPEVQLYAESDNAVRGQQPAVFQVVRTGGSLALPVTVNYTVSGTAVAGTDYTALPGSVTIPAGQDSATISIVGLSSAVATGTKTVNVELQSGPGYDVGYISERTAQASILDNVDAPAGGTAVINPALSSFGVIGSQYGNAQVVSDPTYTQALSVNVTSVPANVYGFEIAQAITSAVNAGDRLLIQFYARSTTATAAKFDAVFEQNTSPYTRSLTQAIQVNSNWTKYQIPVTAAGSYAAGAAQVDFQLGYQIQSLQIAGIQVLNYGPGSDLYQSEGLSLVQSGGSWGSGSTVAATGPGFSSAFQVTTTSVPTNSYQIQAIAKNAAPVLAGDTLTATYYLRSTGPGNATVNTIMQQYGGSYTYLGGRTDTVGSNWTQYTLTIPVAQAYATNGVQLAFNTGYGPQSVEIGGITWTRTGAGISSAAVPATTTAAMTVQGSQYGTAQLVSVTGGTGFTRALQVQTTTVPSASYNFQTVTRSVNAVAAGTVVTIQFYARATGTSGTATLAVALQETTDFASFIYSTVTVGTGWTLVTKTGTVSNALTAGQLQAGFSLGYGLQTVQIGGLTITATSGPQLFQTDDLAELAPVGAGTYGTLSYAAYNTTTGIFQPLQVQTTTQPANAYNFQSVAKTSRAVNAGDTLNLVFYARNVGSTTAQLDAIVQQSSGSFSSLLFQRITLTSNWTQYSYAIPVTQAYAAGALQLAFDFGFAPQTIQLGGVLLTDASPAPAPVATLPSLIPDVTYGGRSGTDAWRTSADTSIDQTREANVNVQVVDQFGRPVNGAVVSVQQTDQAFKFGTAATANYLTPTSTDPTSLKYQAILQQLFNSATIDNALKWPDFLSNPQLGIDAANWIVSHGLYLRGHNIIWPSRSNMPSAIWSQYDSINSSQGATAAANYLESAILARIQSAMSTFDGLAGEWDVVNEPYTNNDAMAVLGNSIVTAWYQAAAAADPDALRVLNDYDIFENNGQNTAHVANFNSWLQQLTSAGVLNEIGEQSHYTESNLTDISTFGSLLNTYSAYGLPIAITEFDFSTLDNQLQSDYLRDYMTMAFSNPTVSEFTQWGFWTGDEWRPNIGLFNNDWSIKPDGQAYEDLVYGNWWTDVRGTSDWGGQYSTRAFQGQYDVTVNYNGQTIVVPATLGANGLTLTVPVTVPLSVTSSSITAPSITYGADGNVTVTESSPDGTPSGNVSLTVDGTQTFTHALVGGSWTFDIPGLSAGDHSLVSTFLTQGPFAGSTATSTLHVNQATLTVTADSQSMVYGGALPTLTASYSGFVNGDTSTALSGSPSLATVPETSHVGSYAITADMGTLADDNYTFAFAPGTLTITQAALTVTADNQSMVYGGALPTLTASYDGLVNGDTGSTIMGLQLSTVPASSHAGSYAITATGATDSDYAITLVNGTLTITQAALTVTADNQSMVYGGALPTLTASYNGLVNGDTPNVISGLSLGTVPANSHVGSYSITPAGGTDPDYTITLVGGTLTITPAALTVQVNNTTKAYGSPNPAFSVSYTGLVNGDTGSALGVSPSYSTIATAGSVVGSYGVTVSGLTSSDYTISYAAGTLTVIPATLVTSSVSVAAYAGAPLVGATVATFSNPNPADTASSYTATIFWGDGSSSSGTITPNGSGGFTVTGSHTYADPASYTVSVQIAHVLGYTIPATVSDTATVTALGTGPSANQVTGIGFWHNKVGQALITSFNGGPNSTTLANWLATTFPNLYGAAAGAHNLTGMSNTQVAAFYLTLWGQSGAKTDLQVLDTALNVYATTSSLGGNAGVAYGFQVTAAGLGAASVNVGQDGAEVGVANGTTLNVYALLVAVNKKAVTGVLYAGNTQLTNEAKDLFGCLNGD